MEEIYTKFESEKFKVRDHLGHEDLGGKITL
jgi:hypothetical protein